MNPEHRESPSATFAAVITRRDTVTPDTISLTFADPNGKPLPPWAPGAHIEVRLASGRRRQYSLCGVPGRRADYRILIRHRPGGDGGGGSAEIHARLGRGDTLSFQGPRNCFHFDTSERDVLFVIGGIGVTAILPMILDAQRRKIAWRAIYTGRSREYMPLLDEVVSTAADRVTVWADDERGRFAGPKELLAAAGHDTAVYVCGPAQMLEAVRNAHNDRGDAPLHYERFGSSGPVAATMV